MEKLLVMYLLNELSIKDRTKVESLIQSNKDIEQQFNTLQSLKIGMSDKEFKQMFIRKSLFKQRLLGLLPFAVSDNDCENNQR